MQSLLSWIAKHFKILLSWMAKLFAIQDSKTICNFWSALATAPAETSAQAKVASNSTESCLFKKLQLPGKLGS
jgi:hypothetical protein